VTIHFTSSVSATEEEEEEEEEVILSIVRVVLSEIRNDEISIDGGGEIFQFFWRLEKGEM